MPKLTSTIFFPTEQTRWLVWMKGFWPYLRSSGIVTVGDVIFSLGGFITGAVIAHQLGPSNFGLYSIFLATIYFSSQFSDLGLYNGLVKYGAQYRHDQLRQGGYFQAGLRAKLTVVLIPQILGLAGLLLIKGQNGILLATSAGLIASSGYTLTFYVRSSLQAREHFFLLALYTAIPGLLNLILISGLVLTHNVSLQIIWIAQLIIYLSSFLVGLILVPRVHTSQMNLTPFWKELWQFSKWLFLSALIYQAIDRITLYLVALKNGESGAGIYSAAFQLALGLSLFSGALQKVFLPKVSGYTRKDQFTNYINQLKRMIPMLIAIWFGMVAFSNILIRFFYGASYSASVPIFYIISISYLIRMIIWPLGLVIWAYNKQSLLTIMNAIQLILMVCLTWLFVSWWGVIGTAIAFVLSDGLLTIFIVPLFVNRILKREVG